MEPTARLFRLLASRRRIHVLRLLAVMGELPVLLIARATGGGMARVSAHLGLLASAGLVWRRRSGRRVYYCVAEQPGSPLVATVLEALRNVLTIVDKGDLRQVARADQTDSPTNSDAALFACFTAFTHPRRLQIIRHLARHGVASFAELCATLCMSPRACMRHLDKLDRRGYLSRRVQGRETTYSLGKGDGPVQQCALRAVRERLADRMK